jgi:hypothetical protein
MANNININVRATVDKAISEVDKVKAKLGNLTTSEGFKSAVMGVGMGAGMAAFNVLSGAIDTAVGKLGETGAAFREDQAGQELLAQALKNNIPAWDGNRKGAEDFAGSLGRLGFADDEVRVSLGQLVGVTHDLTAAQNLTSLAADLARSKGIDLATATDIVTKAHEGNGKALKALGVDIGTAKTAAEMLTAIQTNAAGSAETWAATNEGRLTVSQVAVGEAMEKVGKIVDAVSQVAIPLLADAFVAVTDFMDQNLGPAFKVIGDNMDIVKVAGLALGVLFGVTLVASLGSYVIAAGTAAVATIAALGPWLALAAAVGAVILLFDKISKMPPTKLPGITGLGGSTGNRDANGNYIGPSIQGYASGGVVPGPVGIPTLAIVHGGETITPAGRGGLTVGAININGASGDAKAMVRDFLQELKREQTRQGMTFA